MEREIGALLLQRQEWVKASERLTDVMYEWAASSEILRQHTKLPSLIGLKLPIDPNRPTPTLLYRATRDGYTPEDFYPRCGNKGPFILLAKIKGLGYVLGAYCAVGVPRMEGDKLSDLRGHSFMFSLINAHNHPFRFKLQPDGRNIAISRGRTSGHSLSFGGFVPFLELFHKSRPLNTEESGFGSWCRVQSSHPYEFDDCAFELDVSAFECCTSGGNAQCPRFEINAQALFGLNLWFSFSEVEIYSLQPAVEAATREWTASSFILSELIHLQRLNIATLIQFRFPIPPNQPIPRLIYRATRDGYSPQGFYSRCEEQGPFILLTKIKESGYVFGAYCATGIPAQHSSNHDPTYSSFLFSLTNRCNVPLRFTVTRGVAIRRQEYALYFGWSQLAIFISKRPLNHEGSGAAQWDQALPSDHYTLDSACTDHQGRSSNIDITAEALFGSKTFSFKEVEVYAL